MAETLAIIGASGKIGGATLDALLSHNLTPPSQIVALTSAQQDDRKWTSLASKGVQVRHATFDDPASMESALAGITRLFLVSSPRIALDFHDAPPGQGRERDHFVAMAAAQKGGVKHIYYTSLAFANPSRSAVMTAHERTEAALAALPGVDVTVLREGLYNESWPLYLGHYDLKGDDGRSEVVVAGDGRVSWTSIADLGLATALIIAATREQWAGKTVYLSNTKGARTLSDVAAMVSKARGKEIKLKVVSRSEHEEHHVKERGMEEGYVKWWAKTYDALKNGECERSEGLLEDLLKTKERTPKPVEETVREML